jgi:hypothetical protein
MSPTKTTKQFIKFSRIVALGVAVLVGLVTILGKGGGDAPANGGGSGSGGGGTSGTGVFLDSPVAGLRSEAIPSGKSSVTDDLGTFDYSPGDTVSFYVGNIFIGSAAGATTVTPLSLVADAALYSDFRVINIARFLQSLDEDRDPDNGISISAAVAAATGGIPGLDFGAENFFSAANALVMTLRTQYGDSEGLIDETTVAKHLFDTFDAQEVEFFPPQAFTDNFDSGDTRFRWGCGGSFPCVWEVVSAGPLGASVELVEADAGPDNFVFQSPDPMALDLNRQGSCERFAAEFEEEGTFAFNYFVQTAGPVGGIFDGNNLEVNIVSHTLEYDPIFDEDIIVDSQARNILTRSGNHSGRIHEILAPGHYDFEFCYSRNHTENIGPDFVQIDNVETCAGTGCIGGLAPVSRCRIDQGATVVPDIGALPTETFTLARAPGETIRYYLIIDTQFLDLVSGGLENRLDPTLAALKAEVDGVRTIIIQDGKTCDIDQRTSVLIEMTAKEILDFLAATGVIEAAFDALRSALWDVVTSDSELLGILFGGGVPPQPWSDALRDFALNIEKSVKDEIILPF